MQAIPVNDEPVPFWDGADSDARFAAWTALWFDDEWGSVSNAARFNGTNGVRLAADVFSPLGLSADDACVTDCLDRHCVSPGVARRIADTYELLQTHPFRRRLPPASLPPQPDTASLVKEAMATQLERLNHELRQCAPELIVTLGEAAAFVLGRLVQLQPKQSLPRVRPGNGYGRPVSVRFQGNLMRWMAIKHPGQRTAVHADAHAAWIQRVAPTVSR